MDPSYARGGGNRKPVASASRGRQGNSPWRFRNHGKGFGRSGSRSQDNTAGEQLEVGNSLTEQNGNGICCAQEGYCLMPFRFSQIGFKKRKHGRLLSPFSCQRRNGEPGIGKLRNLYAPIRWRRKANMYCILQSHGRGNVQCRSEHLHEFGGFAYRNTGINIEDRNCYDNITENQWPCFHCQKSMVYYNKYM